MARLATAELAAGPEFRLQRKLENIVLSPRWQPTPGKDRGATSIEYAFIVSLIALLIIGSVRLVGEATKENICSPMDGLANAGVESVEPCP